MREYLAKTVKVGDTVVVALPRELLQAEQIRENMDVKISVQKCGSCYSTPKRTGPSSDDDDPWRLLE